LNYFHFYETYALIYKIYKEGQRHNAEVAMVGLSLLFFSCIHKNQLWLSNELLTIFWNSNFPNLTKDEDKSYETCWVSILSNIMLITLHELGHVVYESSDLKIHKVITEAYDDFIEAGLAASLKDKFIATANEMGHDPTLFHWAVKNMRPDGVPKTMKDELWSDIFAYIWIFIFHEGFDNDLYTDLLEGLSIVEHFRSYMQNLWHLSKIILNGTSSDVFYAENAPKFSLMVLLRAEAFIFMCKREKEYELGEAINRTHNFKKMTGDALGRGLKMLNQAKTLPKNQKLMTRATTILCI